MPLKAPEINVFYIYNRSRLSSAHQALTARIRNAKRLRKNLVPQSDTMTAFVMTVLHFASF